MNVVHILAHSVDTVFPYTSVEELSNFEHHVVRYIENLKNLDMGYDHELILFSEKITETLIIEHYKNIKLTIIPSKKLIYNIEYSKKIPEVFKKYFLNKGNIFHVHGMSSYLYNFISPLFKNEASICEYWGGFFTWKSFPISFPKYALLQKRSAQYYDYLFFQNNIILKKYQKQYGLPSEVLVYIPNAISKIPNSFCKSAEEVNNLLYCGRIVKEKGVVSLLNSFMALYKKYPNLTLTYLGEGDLKEKLIRMVKRYDIEDRVKIEGFVSEDLLGAYYSKNNIFILPSRYDCFPSVLLEAGIYKNPIITTKTHGSESLIKDRVDGIITTEKNMAKDIDYLLKNPDIRKKYSDNLFNKISSEYTWKNVSTQIFKYYGILSDKL